MCINFGVIAQAIVLLECGQTDKHTMSQTQLITVASTHAFYCLCFRLFLFIFSCYSWHLFIYVCSGFYRSHINVLFGSIKLAWYIIEPTFWCYDFNVHTVYIIDYYIVSQKLHPLWLLWFQYLSADFDNLWSYVDTVKYWFLWRSVMHALLLLSK